MSWRFSGALNARQKWAGSPPVGDDPYACGRLEAWEFGWARTSAFNKASFVRQRQCNSGSLENPWGYRGAHNCKQQGVEVARAIAPHGCPTFVGRDQIGAISRRPAFTDHLAPPTPHKQ